MPSYLVLARKYRPGAFSDVVGQDHVIQALSNSIVSGRVAHAFLFSGVRGVGKTTVARILAKSLNCTGKEERQADPCGTCSSCTEVTGGVSVDVHEIDGASHTSVENIREINENIKYPPVSSRYKIIIIDEVHMISINAFNALLKTLEEPPAHAKFIFATTESHKVPATINSRCQRFNFRTISIHDMTDAMAGILEQEDVRATEEALALVAREAKGSFRDALSLLDQVIASGSENIAAEDVATVLGIAGREAFGRLMEAVLERDPGEALKLVHELFEQGYDPEQLVMDTIHYLRNLIVVRTLPPGDRGDGILDASPAELEELEKLAGYGSAEELQYLFGLLIRNEGEIKRSGNPWVALEMTVLRMALAPDIVDLSEMIRRIDGTHPPVGPPAGRGSPDQAVSQAPQDTSKPVGQSARSGPTEEKPPRKKNSEPHPQSAGDEPPEPRAMTGVTPPPDGTPDEIWAAIRADIEKSRIDPAVCSVMEHGRLISPGPADIEIGFHKAFYKQQFEDHLKEKPELKKMFREYLGEGRFKILTLAKETSLDVAKPYDDRADGDSDRNRALKQEALDHPIVRAVQREFPDISIDEIKIL